MHDKFVTRSSFWQVFPYVKRIERTHRKPSLTVHSLLQRKRENHSWSSPLYSCWFIERQNCWRRLMEIDTARSWNYMNY